MSTNFNGLHNFQRKLKNISDKLNDGVAYAVAEKGAEIAQREYSGYSATVEAIEETKSECIVQATGEALTFIEYGTGRPGQNSGYPSEKLPDHPFEFHSAGKERSTQKWEYYYPNPDTKVTVGGVEGWYLGDNFITGNPAGMQMFHTSEELADRKADIVRDYIKQGE